MNSFLVCVCCDLPARFQSAKYTSSVPWELSNILPDACVTFEATWYRFAWHRHRGRQRRLQQRRRRRRQSRRLKHESRTRAYRKAKEGVEDNDGAGSSKQLRDRAHGDGWIRSPILGNRTSLHFESALAVLKLDVCMWTWGDGAGKKRARRKRGKRGWSLTSTCEEPATARLHNSRWRGRRRRCIRRVSSSAVAATWTTLCVASRKRASEFAFGVALGGDGVRGVHLEYLEVGDNRCQLCGRRAVYHTLANTLPWWSLQARTPS